MQENLDDYIKLAQNVKSEEPSVETRKEIQISLQRRKACDARAQKIVEFSVEGKLQPEIFTKCLPFINQSHYQDIVEERAITKLCGYSICGRRIPDMPKKQYFISTKSNKVYDITDRKNYCSNFCYKASLHIKKQIDDSPLWLRKLEDIPEYQLLKSDGGGLPGEYIDQGIPKPAVGPSFTPVGVFTEASLSDMVNKEISRSKPKEKEKNKSQAKPKKSKLVKTMQTITENSEQTEEEDESIRPASEHRCLQKSASLPVIIENEENYDVKYDSCENLHSTGCVAKSEIKKTRKKASKTPKINPEELIKKVIREWLTLESFIFLYGETKVKEILNVDKMSDCFEKLNISELQREQQVKYMDICRRLHMQELADEKFDNAVVGSKLKPVPDYQTLKKENKELNLKVKCFYSGILHEKEDSNFPTRDDAAEEEEPEIAPVLPLVDVTSQKALRRKIFLRAVSKSMQQLLEELRVKSITIILSDLQSLVKTFNLNADNIVFKPAVWNYISVILLHILAIRDSNIKHLLQDKYSMEYIKVQFSILPNREELVSDIMKEVYNVELFIENYISSN
ncbi:unnamed protein product [Phyllotreta striolata]|uniref:RNA polymerase II subunit B1 CTD phosphatase RPAP2 homolog n=1 Tax=Phyllotreta striolata TaxID=444603 RepID=A0A9N9TFH4_PHYSR|nr:unnamed protein product [Phyllotreta striolata]